MDKPNTPFAAHIAQNDDHLLELSLIADEVKKSPSETIGIDDELTAFAFDSRATVVRLKWNNEREVSREKAKLKAYRFATRQATLEGIMLAFGAKLPPDEPDNDEDEIPTEPKEIRDDVPTIKKEGKVRLG